MRPIQWHLKNNWWVSRITTKGDPSPQVPAPHLQWRLKEDNELTGQPLHPIKHALQIFTDASIEGLGAHLDEHLLYINKLYINCLELKAAFLALKEFQDLCSTR